MIRFGASSIVLLAFAAQALALAAALLGVRRNRLANRYLAGLLIVIAGMLTPYIIGYAGFYDAYPWLSFAPFAVPLAIGPLVYGYVRALVADAAIGIGHFALPVAQFAYQAIMFVQPLATKSWFDAAVQEPLLTPALDLLVPAAMLVYLAAGYRSARAYKTWLVARRRDIAPAKRLQPVLAVLMGIAAARIAFDLYARASRDLDYFDVFGFYLLLAIGSAWLGVEGWRHAHAPAAPRDDSGARDWAAQGRDWLDRVRGEGWWREPDIGLAGLARRLGTNGASLSRAINATGTSLPEAIAGMRADAVADRIHSGEAGDLLGAALDAGFGSKASFNRAFKARFGMTPSAWRDRQVADHKESPLEPEVRRG